MNAVRSIVAGVLCIAAGVAGAGTLPDGYRSVKCLVSHGTEYIDTKVVPKSTTRVVLDFALTEKPTSTATCGWGSSSSQEAFMFGANASGFYTCIDPAWKNSSYATDSAGARIPLDLARHTFDIKSGSQKFDGVEYAKWTIGNTASDKQYLYLFATHVEWGPSYLDYKMKAKIYSCKIYDGDTLVRDLVPCVNANGKYVLYDLVGKSDCANAGTGTFGIEKLAGLTVSHTHANVLTAAGFEPGLGESATTGAFTCTAPTGEQTTGDGKVKYTVTGWKLVVTHEDDTKDPMTGSGTSVNLNIGETDYAELEWQLAPQVFRDRHGGRGRFCVAYGAVGRRRRAGYGNCEWRGWTRPLALGGRRGARRFVAQSPAHDRRPST